MRPLRLILVCVLLGAVTTVGVAWWFAWFNVGLLPDHRQVLFLSDTGPWFAWMNAKSVHWQRELTQYQRDDTFEVDAHPPSWCVLYDVYHGRVALPDRRRWIEIRSGFPLAPLSAVFDEDDFLNEKNSGWSRTHAAILHTDPLRDPPVRWLPSRPLPLGFTIDTAFYGSIWFTLIMCPGFVRRKMRQRRGLCPSCGYDMQGSSGTCPECGNRVEGVVE